MQEHFLSGHHRTCIALPRMALKWVETVILRQVICLTIATSIIAIWWNSSALADDTAKLRHSRSRLSLLKYNNIRKDRMMRVQNCSAFRNLGRNQQYSAARLHRLTRDEEG